MRITLKKFLFVSLLCVAITAQAQMPQISPLEISPEAACEMQLVKKLDFMLDGSFANKSVVYKEIAKLKTCGIDEFDVNFFGNLDVFSTILARISKEKKVEQMTFSDVYTEIVKFKKADVYKEIRAVTVASEQLGKTTANIKNWEQDLSLFKDLGASPDVIERVYNYLKSHPDNEMNYQEVLELLKRR